MPIRPVQYNINTKSNEHKHYLEAEGAVDTTGLVKPLPGKGHLINDNLASGTKYFFKDIAYDMKSLKNGIKGTANDHQLGRLNDVGLQLGGIGIATYLASKTTNPRARIMEYVGLGTFLTAMNVYPKIAINKPAELIHGHDIDKWYIDDQGRKKSVNQDSNYVPYDLYTGERKSEDLDEIGDKMGIPRDIKNRHEVIKEQMRKLSTQNNTLWMLTAGLATPAMTALACYGLENYVISPKMEEVRNKKFDKRIGELLKQTNNQELDVTKCNENDLSKKVTKLLTNYKNKVIPPEELDYVLDTLTEHLDNNVSEGIKSDVLKLLKSDAVELSSESVEDMITKSKLLIGREDKELLEPILIPSREEVKNAIKAVIPDAEFGETSVTSKENLVKIKDAISDLIDRQIQNADIEKSEDFLEYLESFRDDIADSMMKSMKASKSIVVNESDIATMENVAKIIGEFKEMQLELSKCKSFKFEHAPETVLARSYGKFEKAVLKELGIATADMKKMRESEKYTAELLEKRIIEICQDEKKYKEVFKNLGKVITEMEATLNGKDDTSAILNLINAIENNYNNAAKRLSQLGGFESTITSLVNEDVSTLGHTVSSNEDLLKLFDGVVGKKMEYNKYDVYPYARHTSKGIGSSKHKEINRMVERYQGVKNSFHRVLHTFEIFKRTMDSDAFKKELESLSNNKLSRTDAGYIEAITKIIRKMTLGATSAEQNLKLNLVNNPLLYIDSMNAAYMIGKQNDKIEAAMTDAAKDGFEDAKQGKQTFFERIFNRNKKGHKGLEKAREGLDSRYQTFISRCRDLFGGNSLDFTKKYHITDHKVFQNYSHNERTRMSIFNLVGKTPISMLQDAAKNHYGTKMWFKRIAGVTAGVFGVTILAQAGFGKLRNPQNIQKQVKDETN